MIDYNKKYKFISKKDEWFVEGTECLVDKTKNGPGTCIWDLTKENDSKDEITYEDMIDHPDSIEGIFKGLRINQSNDELRIWGKGERIDGEYCVLDEFEVIKR